MLVDCITKQGYADRVVERELSMINIECYSCSWNGSYTDYQVYHWSFKYRTDI